MIWSTAFDNYLWEGEGQDTTNVKKDPEARIRSLLTLVYPRVVKPIDKKREIQRLFRHKKRVERIIKREEDYRKLEKIYEFYARQLGLSPSEIEECENDVETEEEEMKLIENAELELKKRTTEEYGDFFTVSATRKIDLAGLYGDVSPEYAYSRLSDALLTIYDVSNPKIKFEMYIGVQELRRKYLDRLGPKKPTNTENIVFLGNLSEVEKCLEMMERNNRGKTLEKLKELTRDLFRIERSFYGTKYNKVLYKKIMELELRIADLYHRTKFRNWG